MRRFLPLWLVLFTTLLALGCNDRVDREKLGVTRSAATLMSLVDSANPTEVGEVFTLKLTVNQEPKPGSQVAFAYDCKAGTQNWQDCDGQFTGMKPIDWVASRLSGSASYTVKDALKEGDREILAFTEEFGISQPLVHTIVPKGSGGGPKCCVEVNGFTIVDVTGTPSAYGTTVKLEAVFNAVAGATDYSSSVLEFALDGTVVGTTRPRETKPNSGKYVGAVALPLLDVGAYRVAARLTVPAGVFSDTAKNLHVVTPAVTTTTVTSGHTPSGVGEVVTFTTTVQSPTATPAGSVVIDFGDGGKSSVILVNGSGTATHAFASVTSYTVQADYQPTTNFLASSAPKITQVVSKTATAIALTVPAAAAYGDNVPISVTVSGGATPTGTIKISWADASGPHLIDTPTLVNGSASVAIATLVGQVAPFTIIADYGGDAGHAGSTASAPITITPKATTLAVATNRPVDSAFGESVALTATVARATPGGAGGPTGTVSFYDGVTTGPVLGGGPVALGTGGTATLNIASLGVGNHNIVGVFTPTAGQIALNWGASNNSATPLVQKVRKASTQAVVITSSTPAGTGANVTFTVGVAPVAPGADLASTIGTGATVTVKDGATTLGTATPGASGSWTYATNTLSVGAHSITADYSGNGSFAATSAPAITQSIEAGASSIALTASKAPSTFGESVTFTAVVTKPGVPTPAGNVVFKDGTRTLGTIALASGTAVVTVADLTAGPHAIQAQFETATSTLAHAVLVAPTTTKLASSANPSTLGQTVTLTATVTSATAVVPTGTVIFKDNGTALATVLLDASGKAMTTLTTGGGTHPLVAEYSGDTSLQGSSDATDQFVSRAKTKLDLASTPNPARVGATVTFTATVSALAPATAIPSGTVVFKEGATTLGTVVLGATGIAAITTSALADGTHTIDASFAQTTDFEAASASVQQTVSANATEITVASSPNPSDFGVPVTITATLGGASTIPTGTVTFKVGTATLGVGTVDATGHAAFTTSALPFGATNITASYGGDVGSLPGSATTQHVVSQGQSTISVVSSANPATVGVSVSFTATVLAGGAAASGDVEFMDGTLSLGTVPIAGAVATLTTSTLAAGTHAISARYLGSTELETSTSTVLSQSIVAATTPPPGTSTPPASTPPASTPPPASGTPAPAVNGSRVDVPAQTESDTCAMSSGPARRGIGGAGMLVAAALLALRRRNKRT